MLTFPFPLRLKLILIFSLVIISGVFVLTIVGINMIGSTIIRQAQDKVRLDLNSAREVYHGEGETIRMKMRLTAERFFLRDALLMGDLERLRRELQKIRQDNALDILTLTDDTGRILVRAHNPAIAGDRPSDPVTEWVLQGRGSVAATVIVSEDEMKKIGAEYAERARIALIPTPKSRPVDKTEETSGMFIKAAAPVHDYTGRLIGVLYGGYMLNRNYDIVDKVKYTVYLGELYKGREIGTATIFLDDARISTNVMNMQGQRAIGTRVSEEVYEQVIMKGKPWIGRAFVVNAWYMTAYEPIRDIQDQIIGMLYVGMLEAPYVDLKNRVVYTFWGIAVVIVVFLFVIANYTTASITRPLRVLAQATGKLAEGDMSQRVAIRTNDEIGVLGDSFNQMAAALQEATEGYRSLTRTLEQKVKEKTDELRATEAILVQSDKLASLGKLGAGVAHELNNPLTSILLNSYLLLEQKDMSESSRQNLQLIIDETKRCSSIVSGLLEFARQTPPERVSVDINRVIESTMLLMETHALMNRVRVVTELKDDLPPLMVDVNKIKQVFTNIMMNAMDAMPGGGTLTIRSRVAEDGHHVEIEFRDTGAGIPEEHIKKIFDPFFTTKGTKGTGLGLAISYGIIEQHGGSIQVRSMVGQGTAMVISIPAAGAAENNKEEDSVR